MARTTRCPTSSGNSNCPADSGSTLHRVRSVTPRACIAACQRASPFTTSSNVTSSPTTRPGCPYGWVVVGTTVERSTRSRVERHHDLGDLARCRCRAAPRTPGGRSASPGAHASTSSFGGSSSWTSAKRVAGPQQAGGVEHTARTPQLVRGQAGRAGAAVAPSRRGRRSSSVTPVVMSRPPRRSGGRARHANPTSAGDVCGGGCLGFADDQHRAGDRHRQRGRVRVPRLR